MGVAVAQAAPEYKKTARELCRLPLTRARVPHPIRLLARSAVSVCVCVVHVCRAAAAGVLVVFTELIRVPTEREKGLSLSLCN